MIREALEEHGRVLEEFGATAETLTEFLSSTKETEELFMVVDEESGADIRASAQSLFNLVIIGCGVIVGSKIAGWVADAATTDDVLDYTKLFSIPMWASLACLMVLFLLYPSRSPRIAEAQA